jgi:hypothetical protein
MRGPAGGRLLAMKLMSAAIALAVFFGFMEAALRAFPQLIGIAALERFEPHMRADIAQRLGLPNTKEMMQITDIMRSDGGPPIRLPAASSVVITRADAADIEHGAIESVEVDANGLCNASSDAKRKSADVFMAGDSFIFCTGVAPADTSAHQLEAMTGLKTYNLGIRGTGPYEYLEMMKRFQPEFRPRVAVLNIYEGNDYRDITRFIKFTENAKRGIKSAAEKGPAWSYAAQFLRANVQLFLAMAKRDLGLTNEYNFHYTAKVGGKPVAMNVTNGDQDEVENAFQLRDGRISLDVFAEPLKNFVAWAHANDIVPVVTYLPSMYTAYESNLRFEDDKVGAAVKQFSAAQRQWFATHAGEIGYRFLDMTPAFQEAANGGVLTHFPANVHLTREGHAVVATQLGKLLASLQLN